MSLDFIRSSISNFFTRLFQKAPPPAYSLQNDRENRIAIAMDRAERSVSRRSPRVKEKFFYGAVKIHPKHLAMWYLFETDAELEEAKQSGLLEEIRQKTLSELENSGYPVESLNGEQVAFTTQEDIRRRT